MVMNTTVENVVYCSMFNELFRFLIETTLFDIIHLVIITKQFNRSNIT